MIERIPAADRLLGLRFQSHPWHGLSPGPRTPEVVTAFIELVPADTVKWEMDKASGFLHLDRPQRYSSLSPVPYGFIPRTLCADAVAGIAAAATGREDLRGDRDPLDLCVLTERTINHGGVILQARPVGGLRVLDGRDVDDKLIAVLESDTAYEACADLADIPGALLDRIAHYFLTYKDMPGTERRRSEVLGTYGRDAAHAVVRAALRDYRDHYGDLERRLADAGGIPGA